MTSFVVAATCVRRRPWSAALWVPAIVGQQRAPDAIQVVIDNDDPFQVTEKAFCEDLIRHWHDGSRKWNIDQYPHKVSPGWHRGTRESGWKEVPEGVAGRYSDDSHAHLARLRNWTVERALELWPQATAVWCCDSDVQPEPDVLELLLAADKPVVGAVVRNGRYAFNFMCGSSQDMANDGIFGNWQPIRSAQEHIWQAERTEPFQVTMTGACALYRADLFRGQGLGSMDRRDGFGAAAGLLRWGPHPRGEDIALAIQARELGAGLWLEPRARTRHYLDGPCKDPLR